jgi:hypothetical protein
MRNNRRADEIIDPVLGADTGHHARHFRFRTQAQDIPAGQ